MNSGDDDAEFSYSMSYTTDPEPWGKMDAGLVNQLYDNSAHCSEGGPMGIWNMITKDGIHFFFSLSSLSLIYACECIYLINIYILIIGLRYYYP